MDVEPFGLEVAAAQRGIEADVVGVGEEVEAHVNRAGAARAGGLLLALAASGRGDQRRHRSSGGDQGKDTRAVHQIPPRDRFAQGRARRSAADSSQNSATAKPAKTTTAP